MTTLQRPPVPAHVDERIFITLGLSTICRQGLSCMKRVADYEKEIIILVTKNNMSFELPVAVTSQLEVQYYNASSMDIKQELLDGPPRVFNFNDPASIPEGPKVAQLEMTSKTMVARRFKYGTTVEVVF
ncbi:laccase-15-like [Setaria viridis]|uniref:laccase-15-like n=1 Tax=Setaria viridis TaxID=4556 RepID=UPI001493D77B|nr:laccase-15-like [Setaria viridis]